MPEPSRTGIEALFPAAAGILVLLVVMGALFSAPAEVAVFLSGVLFFGLGLVFSLGASHIPWGAGLAILGPFLFTSAFLMTAFGPRLILFPLLAAGGVASGLAAGRRRRGGRGCIIIGALWVGIVFAVAFFLLPGMFAGVSFTGIPRG